MVADDTTTTTTTTSSLKTSIPSSNLSNEGFTSGSMARIKPRLLLALYARPKHPQSHHYALFVAADPGNVSPSAPATKYHVKNTLKVVDGQPANPWRFERAVVPVLSQEPRLLACVVIGKVVSLESLEQVIRDVPVLQTDDPDPKARLFSCRTWLLMVLDELRRSDSVSSLVIAHNAMNGGNAFVEELRKQGRWSADSFQGGERIPIKDLMGGTRPFSWARKLLKQDRI